MEYIILIVVLIGFCFFVFMQEVIRERRKERKFIDRLYHHYDTLYEKEYKAERFEKIKSYYNRHQRENQLDDITWNDLEMDELFKKMNSCLSATGEEYLYYVLRTIKADKEEIDSYEKIISFFGENPDLRVKFQYCMHQLGYTGKFSIYDYIENLDYLGERKNWKHYLSILCLLISVGFFWVNFSVGVIGVVILMIYNIISYFKEKGEIEPYITSFAYILRMLKVCEKVEKMGLYGCEKEIEVLRIHCRKIESIQRNSFLVTTDNRVSMSTGDILGILLNYIKMIFHVDLIKFNNMLKHLRGHMEDLDLLISTVGYLESAIAVWIFRESLINGWCHPVFSDESIIMENGYHPLIHQAVKNSIHASKGVLLTGSNASGKSTFLKTVAINSILAQTVNTCASDTFRLPFCRIYTSMALRDRLENGESYYIVEIKALKRILDAALKKQGMILCFVDEVLRGTNTVERIAASSQILSSLYLKNIQCFAATHDIELTDLLQDEYDNYHFEEEIEAGDIKFQYLLKKGKATTRNAIKLLELLGYQKEIIEQATTQAEVFLTNGEWKMYRQS